MKTEPEKDSIKRPLCYTLLLQWLSNEANNCGYISVMPRTGDAQGSMFRKDAPEPSPNPNQAP